MQEPLSEGSICARVSRRVPGQGPALSLASSIVSSFQSQRFPQQAGDPVSMQHICPEQPHGPVARPRSAHQPASGLAAAQLWPPHICAPWTAGELLSPMLALPSLCAGVISTCSRQRLMVFMPDRVLLKARYASRTPPSCRNSVH